MLAFIDVLRARRKQLRPSKRQAQQKTIINRRNDTIF